MNPPFEILEHPADIGLRARGSTPAELFENAAAGFLTIALDPETVGEAETREISAEGPDREALLVNWLQEALWLIDAEGWLPRRITVREITDHRVTATVYGEPRDPSRHRLRLIIKAVTYHQLAIREDNGEWVAEVYLDI